MISAILYDLRFVNGARARAIIAHELTHTRQHSRTDSGYDLPAHIVCQAFSAAEHC